MKKKLTEKKSRKRCCDCVTNQSDCRIRYRARLEKNKYSYLQNISEWGKKAQGSQYSF